MLQHRGKRHGNLERMRSRTKRNTIIKKYYITFFRIIFIHFHIIALKAISGMRRKKIHAKSIMEENYEGNRNCTADR